MKEEMGVLEMTEHKKGEYCKKEIEIKLHTDLKRIRFCSNKCRGCYWDKTRGKNYRMEYQKEYRKGNLDYHSRKQKEWASKNQSKILAHRISKKVQITLMCSHCGSAIKVEKHHPDYSKPDYIIPLCMKCHKLKHSKIVIK